MEKKPPNDDKPLKRLRILSKSMSRKKINPPKVARTIDEIFEEMQGIIDNTPSCSTVDVEAMLVEPLMLQFDEELTLALDIEAAVGVDSGASDEELNDVINKIIGEEESNASADRNEGPSDEELNDVINEVIHEEESSALANINNNTPP